MKSPVDALLEYLRAEEARGVTHVHLDDEARELLQSLQQKARSGNAPGSSPTPAARKQPTPRESAAEAAAMPPAAAEKPAVTRPAPPAVLSTGDLHGSAAERIAALAARAAADKSAQSAGNLRDTLVFSTGNPEASLMLVGEAPGYHEERQREPFTGPAGQKLNEILKAMGLERDAVYISNIVKYRPAMPGQTTNNRKPTAEEMAASLPYIRAEVEIVKPRCIVALGGTAAEGLLGLTGSVGAMRGEWRDFGGIPVRVTYHPAYLLHGNAGQQDKRKIWEDMLAVMAMLEMPISDRQKSYFLPKA